MVQGTLEKPGILLSTAYSKEKKYAEKIRRGKLVIMWYSVDSVLSADRAWLFTGSLALHWRTRVAWSGAEESAHSPLFVTKNKAAIRRLQGVD